MIVIYPVSIRSRVILVVLGLLWLNFSMIWAGSDMRQADKYHRNYKALTKQEGPNVCWDSSKMHSFLDCRLLCFSREEEFNVFHNSYFVRALDH